MFVMRKRIQALLSALCAGFALCGCGEGDCLSRPAPEAMEPMPLVIEEPVVPQTNESLTVWAYGEDVGATVDILRDAGKEFRERYPEVELVIERTPYDNVNGWDAHYTRLATEVMSGKGPDLFWIESYSMDWYKMMKGGAFANLNCFFENDPDYHKEDYNQPVMEGGRFRGCQYLVPTHYSIPVLLSEKSLLEEQKIDISKWTDYFAMWEDIAAYSDRQEQDASLPYPVHVYADYIFGYSPWTMGIRWINLENDTLDLNQPEMERALALNGRLLRRVAEPEEMEKEWALRDGAFKAAHRLADKEELFEICAGWDGFAAAMRNGMAIASFGEPVLAPVRDVNGGIQAEIREALAVRRNSPNQENAYHFIQILLSPEYQEMSISTWMSEIPLNYEALNAVLEGYAAGLDPNMRYTMGGDLGNLQIEAAPRPFLDSYREAASEVSGAYFHIGEVSSSYTSGFYEFMLGMDTFQACIPMAWENIRFYLSE